MWIGTNSTGAKLDVHGQIQIRGGAPAAGRVLTSDADGLASWRPVPDVANISGWTDDGPVVRLTTGSDRVGVGTTSPGEKLDVNGNAYVRGRMGVEAGVYSDPAYSLHVGRSALIREGLETMGNVGLGGGIDASRRLTVYGNEQVTGDLGVQGNVGLGTPPTPSAKLGVAGNVGISGWLYALNQVVIGSQTFPPPYDVMLDVHGRTLFRGYIYFTGQNQAFLNDAGDLAMILTRDGDLCLAGNIDHVWDVNYFGELKKNSDARIKFDQTELDYGLPEVMALQPKRYNQAELEHDKEQDKIIVHPEKTKNDIGLIAQEVQLIIPEAVTATEEGDEHQPFWSITYDKLIPVLIKALQEQQAQIEELKKEIQTIKSGLEEHSHE